MARSISCQTHSPARFPSRKSASIKRSNSRNFDCRLQGIHSLTRGFVWSANQRLLAIRPRSTEVSIPAYLNGAETPLPTRPICPDCPKTLDQFDIRSQRALHLPHIRLLVRRFNSARPRRCSYPRDTRISDRRIPLFWARLQTRRILSRVLHEQKSPIGQGGRAFIVVNCRV